MKETLLKVNNLSVSFLIEKKYYPVVRDISFATNKGEILGVVGESGSGKSVTAKTILRLISDPPGRITGGEILLAGKDILAMNKNDVYEVRGNRISMIFQEPMTSLNPVYTCGDQIAEAIMLHQHVGRKEAAARALEMIRQVGISMPEARYRAYPHELSGGMRQRIMIAIALSCNPELLIADEPTTALDPTIQAQILDLIRQMQQKTGMGVLYITHDLAVVAELCHRVVVMYAGIILEEATVRGLFKKPLHPYTQGLMKAVPSVTHTAERLYTIKENVPHITNMPTGCPFHPRCPHVLPACGEQCPPMVYLEDGHGTRCIRYRELAEGRLAI